MRSASPAASLSRYAVSVSFVRNHGETLDELGEPPYPAVFRLGFDDDFLAGGFFTADFFGGGLLVFSFLRV